MNACTKELVSKLECHIFQHFMEQVMTSSITMAKRTKMLSSITKKKMETQGKKADWRKEKQRTTHHSISPRSSEIIARATTIIIKAVQNEAFEKEFGVMSRSIPENNDGRSGAKARKKSLKKIGLPARPLRWRCRTTESRRPPSPDQPEFGWEAPTGLT